MSPTQREFVRYRVIQVLADNPKASQRELAKELGVSLGSINYCIQSLIDKGSVKVENFSKSNAKKQYAYILTPSGLKDKAEITLSFLSKKKEEYKLLKMEIAALEQQTEQIQADFNKDKNNGFDNID